MSQRRSPLDYARAFFKALGMTLRGETIPTVADRFPAYNAWWSEIVRQLDTINRLSSEHGVDPTGIIIRAEGRETTMRTILDGVRYHAETEYPVLFERVGRYDYMGMIAINLNDRFLVLRLSEHAGLPAPVREAVTELGDHLAAIPQQVQTDT